MNVTPWACALMVLTQATTPSNSVLSESPATPPATTRADDAVDLASVVRKLTRQLDDRELEKRQAAENELLDLGVPILELLPPVTPQTPAEMKERLGRVRRALEKRLAESASHSTTITLRGEMSFAAAMEQFERQTGNRVVGYERLSGRVTVDFQETPYWQALDQVLDQVDMTINPYGGQLGALVLQARGETEEPRFGAATYAGVFRFEPLRLEARRDLRNPAVDGLRLSVQVAWEPRITPIALRQAVAEIEVHDDRDRLLELAGRQPVLEASAEVGMSAVELTLPLPLPDRDARRLSVVRGTLTALVPGRVETFEFPDLANARDVEQTRAGVTVTFERLRKNRDIYEARVNVRFENPGNALESHRGWVYRNEAFLRDAAGNHLENLGLQQTRQEPDQVGIAYLFNLPEGPGDHTLIYKSPAVLMRLPIPYELTEIPLP